MNGLAARIHANLQAYVYLSILVTMLYVVGVALATRTDDPLTYRIAVVAGVIVVAFDSLVAILQWRDSAEERRKASTSQ